MKDRGWLRHRHAVASTKTQQLDDLMKLYRYLYARDRNDTRLTQVWGLVGRVFESSSPLELPAWVSALVREVLVRAAPIIINRELTKNHTLRNHQTIIIQWSGPYNRSDVELTDLGYGLYLFAGKRYRQSTDRIQYCGITERLYRQRIREHHPLDRIKRDLSIWLGTIQMPERADRVILERAEKLLIYALQPGLNKQSKVSLPQATTVVSHWVTPDSKAIASPYENMRDVISWDGQCWR